MTDAPLSFVASPDGTNWSKSQNIVNGYTDYGLQMAVYRGELYGIMTQTVQYPGQLFATKYKVGTGWKAWRSLPSKFLSQGRVSVSVLEDRFFIARRGTNDAVYLTWTDDFDTFHDVGRVGSQYAKTIAAPAICAHDGMLYLAGVGPDHYIYYTIVDANGDRKTSWKKIDGTGTQSALSMVVYNGHLYLFHCGWDNNKFFSQTLGEDGEWSALQSYTTNITSGLSAVSWKYNQIVVTYRGRDKDIKLQTFDGESWSKKQYVPNAYMMAQTGLSTWAGQIVVSYAATSDPKKGSSYYQRPLLSMDEKTGVFGDVREMGDDEHWDCQWDQNNGRQSWMGRFFCL